MNALQSFLREFQMPDLVKLDRLCPVLVRCGGGRFTAPAQDVKHFIACVEAGGDYVRDVSLPVGSVERAASRNKRITRRWRLISPANRQQNTVHRSTRMTAAGRPTATK